MSVSPEERERRHRLYISVKEGRDTFAAHEVDVSASYRRGAHSGRVFPKDCWHKACRYVVEHVDDGAMLVHGTCADGEDPDFRFEHAWVELPGGVVFDGVFQRFYEQASYYAAMGANCRLRMDALTAVCLSVRRGAYESWSEADVAAVAADVAAARVRRLAHRVPHGEGEVTDDRRQDGSETTDDGGS